MRGWGLESYPAARLYCEKDGLSDKINSHRDLEVYKLAFSCAMEIFQISKSFPASHLLDS
jgi:hypothetical protein